MFTPDSDNWTSGFRVVGRVEQTHTFAALEISWENMDGKIFSKQETFFFLVKWFFFFLRERPKRKEVSVAFLSRCLLKSYLMDVKCILSFFDC